MSAVCAGYSACSLWRRGIRGVVFSYLTFGDSYRYISALLQSRWWTESGQIRGPTKLRHLWKMAVVGVGNES